jgi:hypothetical protein
MTDAEKFRLSLLHPAMRARAEGIVARMKKRGFREPYIGSTYRTPAEQLEAVTRGTTGRKQKLSWHLIRRAVDFRDRLPSGRGDPSTRNELFFLALWEEATMAGCRSLAFVSDRGGHPVKLYINNGKLWDAGHVEACQKEAPHLLTEPPEVDADDDEDFTRERALGLAALPPSPFDDK